MPPRVVAVVVAHDRRALVLGAVRAVLAQTRPPEAVVVVDNASTDGTAAALRATFPAAAFPQLDLVVLDRNTGGAGGFAVGLSRALERHRPDWLWLMDDDTEPTPTALAALLDAADHYPGPAPALVASRVVWHNGAGQPVNTPRKRPGAPARDLEAAAAVGCVPVRSASFVSVLLSAPAVRETGLPVADYFLWNDDFEFTTRLLRDRVGLYCPDSFAVHRTRTLTTRASDPGERFYYEVRNKVWTFARSPGLAPAERVLYAGSTLRWWARLLRDAPSRTGLLTQLRWGVTDGLRAGPRPNDAVLARVREVDPPPEREVA